MVLTKVVTERLAIISERVTTAHNRTAGLKRSLDEINGLVRILETGYSISVSVMENLTNDRLKQIVQNGIAAEIQKLMEKIEKELQDDMD